MNDREAIQSLFRKYLSNQLNEQELDELLSYFDLESEQSSLRKMVSAELEKAENQAPVNEDEIEELVDEVERKLYHRIQGRKSGRITHIYKYAAAIAILVAMGISGYWYLTRDRQPAATLSSRYGDDVLPGGDRATLKLADGKVIDLDQAANGLLAEQHGISISKNDNGLLSYEIRSTDAPAAEVEFHTITTPRGGQYQVVLPDGSKVWLNAASSLRYPSTFTGSQERRVELSGEAYFEVAKNENQPFIVRSNGQVVEVLGTAFNISAYGNEPVMATTLVNGRVRIRQEGADKTETLLPGQQAITTGTSFQIKQVNAADYIAWKKGLILLQRADLPAVIRQIERWYDVEFTRPLPVFGQTLSGELSRNVKLSEVLYALEVNTGIQFKIQGRKVMMSP